MLTLTTFNYTRNLDCYGSSFVSDVYYNQNNQELLVELYDKDDDEYSWYLYHDVPLWRVDEFDNASSKGTYYNQQIKPHYGPADQLSDEPDTVYTPVPQTPQVTNGTNFVFPEDSTSLVKNTVRTTYALYWSWNGQEMPAHVVEAASEAEAVEALRTAVNHLGLTGATVTHLVYTATVERKVNERL